MVKRVLLGDHPKGDGPIKFTVGSVQLTDSDDPNEPYKVLGADGEWHMCNPDGTKYLRAEVTVPDPNSKALPVGTIFTQRCETEPSSIAVRADLCVVNDGVATFPNSPLNTLIAAARTLCDNVETVGTHNRIDTEHIDKLRQALDKL